MTVSIVTFANFGKKQNLKTPDILPVVEAFAQKGELAQVICQIDSGSGLPQVVQAIPEPLRYMLRGVERLGKRLVSRRFAEEWFDRFACLRLSRAEVTILHGGHFLRRTAQMARAKDSILIDIPVAAHPATNAAIEQEELLLLEFLNNTSWFTQLMKEAPHVGDFDYIIALSNFVKESYVNAGFPEQRIYIASPDIDIARFSPASSEARPKKFRVLYAAYTAELKGLHYLLDAWEKLALPNAELVIAGGYGLLPEELKHRYNQRITRNATIRWVGSTDTPEMLYREASIFVFPSLTEGFGRVTLEAMACGLPVITTENAKGIVENGRTGFVVPIRDANALAEKIKYLYEHQDEAREMGKAARKAVEEKKPFGEAVYEIYQEILRREGKLKA